METLLALDLAEDVLTVVDLRARLGSTPASSGDRRLPRDIDESFIFERAEELVHSLSKKNSHTIKQTSANGLKSIDNVRALRELVSDYAEDCETLLKVVENTLKDVPERPTLHSNKDSMRASVGPILRLRHQEEKVERFTSAVAYHIRAIIRSRISEIENTMELLENVRRYARPENESGLHSLSQELDALRLEFQTRSGNPDAESSITFTQNDLKLFRKRLMTLNEIEDNMFADKIVASLNYDSRPIRQDSVPQAHKDTFQWAFDSKLSEWFRSESGAFWVSGKPGSGKSTFMKFIARHPRTRELLSDWAGSAENLAVAAHFFWIAGTPIQKSWQGLLQSLLFDVFQKRPIVVSLISPDRWAAAKAGDWQTAAQPWSVTELAAALRALASADTLPVKLCFFIDGLDEYDSDHAELCNVLHDMASSRHIKLCVSSRPWAVFEESFGGDGKHRLDIHQLTRNDIHRFVTGQLQSHLGSSTGEAKQGDSEELKFVERIVAQADGVFLWAFLVTRSLREGLANGNSTTDLNKRLIGLPRDLEQLFKHMLESVNQRDHSKMAGILEVAAHAFEPLHIDLYWHVERQFEEDDYAYSCPIKATPFDRISKDRDQTSLSIAEKTKGLLKMVNQRVEFLHRTVKDFVLTKDTGEYLRSKLPADYSGFISIASAYLSFLKTTSHSHSVVAPIVRLGWGLNSGPFITHLNQALMYASEALKSEQSASGHPSQTEILLDRYELTIEEMVLTGHVTIARCGPQQCNPRLPFREELLRHDLASYVAKRVQEQPDFFDIFDKPPLFAALTPMSRSSGESPAPVPEILDILLRHGGDPNIVPRPRVTGLPEAVSPWVLFARGTMSVFNMLSGPSMFPALRFNDSLNRGIFEMLLSYGADPNKPLLDRSGAHTAFSHFLDISLSNFLGEECFEGYLRTLDAFLRAGASLAIPNMTELDPKAEAAFGNLARLRPEESVLASYCVELKSSVASLAADPVRTKFVSSVTERLILHCSGNEESLRHLSSAISGSCPPHVADPLLRLVENELNICKEVGRTRKRRRAS